MGTFPIPAVPPDSIVIARVGDRYTSPVPRAARVELKLVKNGAVHGTIAHGDAVDGRLEVHFDLLPPPLDRVEFTPPIAADGSWRIEHVPYGKGRVVVEYGVARREYRFVDAMIDRPVVGPLDADITPSGVQVLVVVRNQADFALSFAIAWVVRGKFTGNVVHDLSGAQNAVHAEGFPRPSDDVPALARDLHKGGDVLVTAPSVDPGAVTVCAMGAVGNFMDEGFRDRFNRHIGELGIACVPLAVGDQDQVVLVEVPPMKRLGD